MIYALLTTLVIVVVIAALVAAMVGLVSFQRLFRMKLSTLRLSKGFARPSESDRRAAAMRSLRSMAFFLGLAAVGVAVTILRDFLVAGKQ